MVRGLQRMCLGLLVLMCCCSQVWGWSAETHMFIATEAGLEYPVTACFPDLSKKDNDKLLGPYHWHNAAPATVVDAAYIDKYPVKSGTYVKKSSQEFGPAEAISIRVPHPAGVLYWVIIEQYNKLLKLHGKQGWERDYYLATLAHYVADLSMPLHNFPHGKSPASDGQVYEGIGTWAVKKHGTFDSALDAWLPLTPAKRQQFEALLTPVSLFTESQLKAEVAKIANKSIALANKCYSEGRVMTKDEALAQAALSVSLLKAMVESSEPQ